MCGGDGGVNLNTCVGVCDSVDTLGVNLGSQVVGGWYLYCTLFFKAVCPNAREFLDADTFAERCGPDSPPALGDAADSNTS
jgi:hypothetical protein